MLTAKEKMLLDALEPLARERGVEVVTVEVAGAKKAPTIRVFIDTEHGVSFDELSAAQDWISPLMDEVDPFPGAYTLEVSSPGIDRPLRTPDHFERFAGETVVVVCSAPINGRTKWTGTLCGFRDGCVVLDVDGVEEAIGLEGIKRANVKGTVDFSKQED
ncbi:MAG: ribosome maturation factor RimP [Eggerthellaceae bacterium]|nr:ribosome maturation factor RimP [Eggerthellaceae bacterium]